MGEIMSGYVETVEACLCIELNVSCPHCAWYFDLLSGFSELNDEGQLLEFACPSNEHWSIKHAQFKECVDCPQCGEKIFIEGIGW